MPKRSNIKKKEARPNISRKKSFLKYLTNSFFISSLVKGILEGLKIVKSLYLLSKDELVIKNISFVHEWLSLYNNPYNDLLFFYLKSFFLISLNDT
jgi:hypothetical protein